MIGVSVDVISLDGEDETLEILTLGVIDVDGVVGRLGELMEYTHATSRLCGCREDGETELFF